ncbi:DUF397 domain-containing protein [Kitasatospora sp. NPDC059747]|uniref:DUF397 domain-containing protein n=1 Tax=Kitasatospora sp. NPDC059747 TaxID=3346930 RepID=UPI0036627DD1
MSRRTDETRAGQEHVTVPGVVHVRDSKDKSGPQPAFEPDAWKAFGGFARATRGYIQPDE